MDEDLIQDILREVINIGVGDAAAALSILVNNRVVIKTPDIYVLDTQDATDFIQEKICELGIYISQDFKGKFSGKTLLFYSKNSCASLLKLLLGKETGSDIFTDNALATLEEIGNIVMVSCITTISNILEDTVEFQIPDLTLEISDGYFKNLVSGLEGLDKTIIIRNQMVVKDMEIEGYFFILLSFGNFLELIKKMAADFQQ